MLACVCLCLCLCAASGASAKDVSIMVSHLRRKVEDLEQHLKADARLMNVQGEPSPVARTVSGRITQQVRGYACRNTSMG